MSQQISLGKYCLQIKRESAIKRISDTVCVKEEKDN